jgi:hypothetical protein
VSRASCPRRIEGVSPSNRGRSRPRHTSYALTSTLQTNTATARRSLPASDADAGHNPPWRTKETPLYKPHGGKQRQIPPKIPAFACGRRTSVAWASSPCFIGRMPMARSPTGRMPVPQTPAMPRCNCPAPKIPAFRQGNCRFSDGAVRSSACTRVQTVLPSAETQRSKRFYLALLCASASLRATSGATSGDTILNSGPK